MSLPSGLGGTPRASVSPLEVRLLRNGIAESRHRVHAVVCDGRGRVLMRAGDPQQLSFVRSALKPLKRSPGNHNSSKMVGTPPKARVRRTSITGSPVRKAKARATSALARKRLQAKMVRWAGPWLCGLPWSGCNLRKRN